MIAATPAAAKVVTAERLALHAREHLGLNQVTEPVVIDVEKSGPLSRLCRMRT